MSVKAELLMPNGFLWGCATAAHQVEGDSVDDWSQWEEGVGRIYQNQRSGAACEWWRGRFLEDFDRAATMRNNAQRLSIAWSRIEPHEGQFDESALGRYREMLVALHDRGMKPMVTLHHFTNPDLVRRARRLAQGGRPLALCALRPPRRGGFGRPLPAVVHHQ